MHCVLLGAALQLLRLSGVSVTILAHGYSSSFTLRYRVNKHKLHVHQKRIQFVLHQRFWWKWRRYNRKQYGIFIPPCFPNSVKWKISFYSAWTAVLWMNRPLTPAVPTCPPIIRWICSLARFCRHRMVICWKVFFFWGTYILVWSL